MKKKTWRPHLMEHAANTKHDTQSLKKFMGFKIAAVLLITAGFAGALAGCHSGTMRGVGSDVEKLGEKMQ